jgi:regulatory protein
MYIIEGIIHDEDSNEVIIICGKERLKITVCDFEQLDVSEGDSISQDEFDLLQNAVERLSCIKKAFDFLSYGDLSEKQLRDKLCRKFPKELSVDVAQLFVERGYVDDLRLAKRYAETFYEFKNMGINRIRNELYRRGISKENIEEAISDYENEDQYERIEQFIRKKYDISKMNDIKYRQKVYSGALRAGFNGSDIGDVIRNFESE